MTRKSRIVLSTAILAILAASLAVVGLGMIQPKRPSTLSLPPRFPAFTMIREETSGGVTRTYEFVYKDDHTWRQTLLAHDGDPRSLIGAGHTMELRDGRMIFTVAGSTHSAPAPTDGLHVPGDWLVNEAWFRGRASARRAEIAAAQRGAAPHLTMTDGSERHTVQFHAETGIPVHYELHVAGELVESHRVTSLVLATGERVR